MADRVLVDRIAQAIGDPGSIVGHRDWDNDEPVTRWAARAVMAVLAERKIVEVQLASSGVGSPEQPDVYALIAERVAKARSRFPGNQHMAVALMEEVGEVARGLLEGDAANVRDEAIDVACVAVRIYEENDADFAGDSPAPRWDVIRGLIQPEGRSIGSSW